MKQTGELDNDTSVLYNVTGSDSVNPEFQPNNDLQLYLYEQKLGKIEYERLALNTRLAELDQMKQEIVNTIWELKQQTEE